MNLTLLSPHEKDLGGGFTVRRLLPAARQRSVGPFIFFDHFGPVQVDPADNHDVRPHPHIGLATVTYLFAGAMMHRDSLGSEQRIEPGAINWMNAGRGIVHSERRPADLASRPFINHGLQLWVALPATHEESEPSFVHTPADAIPHLIEGGADVRVLVGEAFGVRSPVATQIPTLYLDVKLAAGQSLELPPLAPQMAVYSVSTDLKLADVNVAAHQMAVLRPGQTTLIEAGRPARFVVIGGEPLDGPRYMWWNFVSTRRERIEQAATQWREGHFPLVPGEAESIPLPDTPLPARH